MDRFVALSLLEDLQFPPPPTHPLEVGSHQGNAYLRKVLEGPPVTAPNTTTKSNKGGNDGYLSAGKEDADGVEEKPKSRQARAKAILHLAAVAQRLGKRWSDAEVVPYLLRCCEDDDEIIGLAVAAVVPALAGKAPLEFPAEPSPSSTTKLPETGGFKGHGAAIFLHHSNGDVSLQRDSDLNIKMAGVCATSHSSILNPLPSLVAVNVVAKQARLPRPTTSTSQDDSSSQQPTEMPSVAVVSPEALVPVILALCGMSSVRVRKYVADVTIPMLCFGVPFSATYDNAYYNYSQFQASSGGEMVSSTSSSSPIDPFTSNSQRRRIVELIQGARSDMTASTTDEAEGVNTTSPSSAQKLFLNILSFLLVGCTSGEACGWGTEAFGEDAQDNDRMVELFRRWRWQHSSYSLWSLGCNDDDEGMSDEDGDDPEEEDTPSNPLCVAAGLRAIANLLSLLAEGATASPSSVTPSNDNKPITSDTLLANTKALYTPYYPKEEARLLSIGFFADATLFDGGFVEQVLLIAHVVAFEPNTGSGGTISEGRAALGMLVDERGSMIANPSTNPSTNPPNSATSDPFCNYFGAGPSATGDGSPSPSTPKTLSRYVFGPFALLEVLRVLPSLAVLSATCPDVVPPQLRITALDIASILFTVCAMPEPTPPSQSEVPPPITLRPPASSLPNNINGSPISLSKSQVNLLQSVRRTFSVDPCRESIDGASTLLPNQQHPPTTTSSSSHSNPKRVMLYRSRSAAGNNHLIAAGAIQCICSVLRHLSRHSDAADTLLLLAALRHAVLEPLSQHISWKSRYVLAEGLPSLTATIAVALGGADSSGLIQSLLHIANPSLSMNRGPSYPLLFEGGNAEKQLHISRRTTHTLHGSIVSILQIVRSLTDPRTETEDEVRAVALSVISMPGHSKAPGTKTTTTTLSQMLTGYEVSSSAPPDMVMALLILVDFLKAAHAASNELISTSSSSSSLQRISPKVIIHPAAVASDLLDIARQVAEGRPNLPVPASMGVSSPTGTMVDAETSLAAAALAMSEVHRERVKGHVPALVVRLADLASGSSSFVCVPSVASAEHRSSSSSGIVSLHPIILFTSTPLVDPASSDPNWLRTECAAILGDLAQEPSAVVQMSLANALLRQRGATANSTPPSQWGYQRRLTPNHELLLHIARNLINSDTWRVRQHFCDTAVLLWIEAVGPALTACGEVLSSIVNSSNYPPPPAQQPSEVSSMLSPLVATLAALQSHTTTGGDRHSLVPAPPSFLPGNFSTTSPYFLTAALHTSTVPSPSVDGRPADVARDIFTPLDQQPGQASFHNMVKSLLAYREVEGAQLWANFEFGMTWWLKVWVALLFDGVQSVRSAATTAMGTALDRLLLSSSGGGDAAPVVVRRATSHRASNLLTTILINCDLTQVVMSSPLAMTKFHNRVTVLKLLTTLPQVHRGYIVDPLLSAFSKDPITNVRMAVSKCIMDLLLLSTTTSSTPSSTSDSSTAASMGSSSHNHKLLKQLVVDDVGCRLGADLDMGAVTTLLQGLVGDASKDVRDLAAVAYAKVPIRY